MSSTSAPEPLPESPHPPISIGFLLLPLQLTDISGPMDIVYNITTSNIAKYAHTYPLAPRTTLLAQSLNIQFHCIGPTLSPVELSGNFLAQPTCTLAECPPLDYLLVGGPDPSGYALQGNLPGDIAAFLVARTPECRAVFATCTGAIVLGAAGLLDGRAATTNHMFARLVGTELPRTRWDWQRNWVVDGKWWTAGGALAGMDMVAEWARGKAGRDMVDFATMLLEWAPRDVWGKWVAGVNGRGERVEGEV